MVRSRMCAWAARKIDAWLHVHVADVETGYSSCWNIFLKYYVSDVRKSAITDDRDTFFSIYLVHVFDELLVYVLDWSIKIHVHVLD